MPGPTSSSLTKQQRLRTEKAIKETRTMLQRAMAYQHRFRDYELIAFCQQHLVKLNAMLEGREPPPPVWLCS